MGAAIAGSSQVVPRRGGGKHTASLGVL